MLHIRYFEVACGALDRFEIFGPATKWIWRRAACQHEESKEQKRPSVEFIPLHRPETKHKTQIPMTGSASVTLPGFTIRFQVPGCKTGLGSVTFISLSYNLSIKFYVTSDVWKTSRVVISRETSTFGPWLNTNVHKIFHENPSSSFGVMSRSRRGSSLKIIILVSQHIRAQLLHLHALRIYVFPKPEYWFCYVLLIICFATCIITYVRIS